MDINIDKNKDGNSRAPVNIAGKTDSEAVEDIVDKQGNREDALLFDKMTSQEEPVNIENERIREASFDIASEVIKRSHVNYNNCYHCRCCAGGCPFFQAMDYAPHGVIRLLQLGCYEKALRSSTIWICVGCNTCSTVCPMAIDISAMMDALRQIAIEKKIKIAQPGILGFHKEVLNSIERHGRTHKLEIMLRYKVRTRDLFSDMDVGLKMLAKRKLDLMPSKIEDIDAIKKIFKKD
ncbi:MAG: 4Fe-4S dicluster domain-containing protein [Desulfamplus sp.]|nr:4Fe-4S dicluster domain-containing protein [Desulfamplus sp.]